MSYLLESGTKMCSLYICNALLQNMGAGKPHRWIWRCQPGVNMCKRKKNRDCCLEKNLVGQHEKMSYYLRLCLGNHLWAADSSRLPSPPPLSHHQVWGRRVVFRFYVNSQSWAGSWNINRQSIYKRVRGTVRSLGNLHLAFWLTCDCTVQLNKRQVERVLPTSSRLWKEQGLAVKRPCRIILSNLEIYPIFSVLYQSGRQTLCRCRLKIAV